jgi:predicted transcriptional regulator
VENDAKLEKLFFELASESRLSILHELEKENLKMQEIARRLNVTATEAFRQLERLSAALLVKKQSDGTFALAEYGKMVLQLSSSLDFVSKYRLYFSMHDVMRLPFQLVNRLGELSQASLGMDTIENLNRAERAFMEAEEFGWGIAEGTIPVQMNQIMAEKVQKSLKLKFILPENRLPAATVMVKNVEVKGVSEIPAIVVLTEKEGAVCFRQLGGRVDYAGFFGKDPTFLNWVKDLFLYYWEKGKRA